MSYLDRLLSPFEVTFTVKMKDLVKVKERILGNYQGNVITAI